MARRAPAREAATWRGPDDLWLDHARIEEDDLKWMAHVERLTLWNVTFPAGLLARLRNLWFLDVRGGTGADASFAEGCEALRGLVVNQVRGVTSVDSVAELTRLELLSLYGLPRLEALPSLAALTCLQRLELGSLKGLRSAVRAAQAPVLRELVLSRKVALTGADVDAFAGHPTLAAFSWFTEDVPRRVCDPVIERFTHLGEPRQVRPEHWFAP